MRCWRAVMLMIGSAGAPRFHGASTGRWAGNGPQPQNLKRPLTEDIDAAVTAIAPAILNMSSKLYPQPLAIIGDISRSLITAAPWARSHWRGFQLDRKPGSGLDRW